MSVVTGYAKSSTHICLWFVLAYSYLLFFFSLSSTPSLLLIYSYSISYSSTPTFSSFFFFFFFMPTPPSPLPSLSLPSVLFSSSLAPLALSLLLSFRGGRGPVHHWNSCFTMKSTFPVLRISGWSQWMRLKHVGKTCFRNSEIGRASCRERV